MFVKHQVIDFKFMNSFGKFLFGYKVCSGMYTINEICISKILTGFAIFHKWY